ncbi:endonuclease/exonuclease/phosphatase family protein [Alteriqipengyuania sp. WL0013]|uniref:endonuclease/exonuclease/phosphatase family protein n=1 Tax=Alteriqipengyuania sp. WL0013 TaxID=3110773 RepID=UPI002BF83809|nr:endonuclease/exonuclease/phosphatase family protein [Alteriqipengyuania sp. WL0013]MEB3416789.1 endonuclease/exonuclease/phosphatase family protein [Alteriqipengyuania sp. WL0013]
MRSLTKRDWPFLVAGAILLLLALISLWPTNRGLVRILDFVREPAIFLAAAVAIAALFLARNGRWPAIGLCALAAITNLVRIWPYTALAPSDVALPDQVDGMNCARVLSFNVLQTNDRYPETAALIEKVDPDILLLMETHEPWIEALGPTLARYDYTLIRPLDNKYGMAFATRLQVDAAEMAIVTGSNTPTLYATLRMADGARFELIGLHPRPPLPGESTDRRDANIARAGSKTPDGLGNVLAIGDFNDVPWSRTTENFREEGDYLDPRVGRGTFATFPASLAFAGWPLDQIMIKDGVKVAEMNIGRNVGSDHLPMIAKVCVDPASPDADIENPATAESGSGGRAKPSR